MRKEIEEKCLELSITEGGKEVRSRVIASWSELEEKCQECSKREEVGLATSVETSGVDWGRERSCWEQKRKREGRSAM